MSNIGKPSNLLVRLLLGGSLAFSPLASVAEPQCLPAQDVTRIAVAGGSVAEVIYALGLGAQLVAADRTSNYPVAATRLPSIGYVRAISAEGLLGLNPSLVIGEHDIGPLEVVSQVQTAGVPVAVIPEEHSVAGIFDKVSCIASVVGAPGEATKALLSKMSKQVRLLEEREPSSPIRVAILLSLTEGVPTGGGRETSAQGVLDMAGATNVFASFRGWKPISLESMAQSNPEYIVMPIRGLKAAGGRDAVLNHPSIRVTQAGKHGRVLGVDGMSLLGFGPRTLETAMLLAQVFGDVRETSLP